MTAAGAVAELLDRGLTKSELAARSGVSRSLIDDYLKGRRQPTVAQLERLGAAAEMRLTTTWSPIDDVTPRWARPKSGMTPPPLTMAERAIVLARSTDLAMVQRRRPRGALRFPPFRSLKSTSAGRGTEGARR